MHRIAIIFAASFSIFACSSDNHPTQSTKESIGEALFFDTSLSSPPGQACATCHDPKHAFADPRDGLPTSEGAVKGVFGKRQTPSLKYMAFSPAFHFDAGEEDFVGGQFWDGRAGDLKAQAKFPFLSPREMNNSSPAELVAKVQASDAADALRAVYGANIFDNADAAFDAIADALASFERTEVFSPFDSKYDFYLQGKVQLSAQERRGLEVFESPSKGNCAACHPSTVSDDGAPPLFTDFTYDNLGVPKNPSNPFYTQSAANNPEGANFIDLGLALTTERTGDEGRMKVPSLRNIAVTAPYFHNGVFGSLEEVGRFYSERDVGGIEPAEISETMNRDELGNLGLSDEEISDLAVFLKTLTDGYEPR